MSDQVETEVEVVHPSVAKIGKPSDVLNLKNTKDLKSPEENQKNDTLPTDEDAKEAPITSMAQLKAHRMKHGTPPAHIAEKENKQVKELEEKILAEGAKKVRTK